MEPASSFDELEEQTAVRRPEHGPLVAQVLWMFGALLWGYVVLGELVTNRGMPELLAIILLLMILGFAAFVARELPRKNRAPLTRKLGPVAGALGLFVAVLVVTISLAATAGAHHGAVSVALWFVAAFALLGGRHTARREQQRAPLALRDYFAWAACGMTTLFALLSGL
jgi:hypothetical protein